MAAGVQGASGSARTNTPVLKATLSMEDLVTSTRRSWTSTIREKKIALVVDEWGAWLAPMPGSTRGLPEQQNSLRDALIAALNLNIFARHADRVRMANIAQMVNVLQAMILTDKEKMLLTPTYHVFTCTCRSRTRPSCR